MKIIAISLICVFVVTIIAIKKVGLKRKLAEHNAKNRAFCKITDDFKPQSLNDSIRHIARFMSKRYPRLKVETELKGSLLPLRMERKIVEDVFINLLKNAAEAIKDKGKILIRTQSRQGWYDLEVIDNGQGIAPRDIENIFKAGYTHKKKKGHGLGLYWVKKEIERSGGSITVQSQKGETKFKISIPQKKINAVVIEDEPVLRRILTLILKRAGIKVSSFSRFETINYKEVDVLYLDIMLWEKNALEEYKSLRQKNPHLIIIFVSASENHHGLKNILEKDKKTILLLKPYHESEPVDKLINLLAKN